MAKLFTISAFLGFAVLAAGAGLFAGFSGGSSEGLASSPIPVTHSPESITESAQPAPACTGAVPSALRIERFSKAPVSPEATVETVPEPLQTPTISPTTSPSNQSFSRTASSQTPRRLSTLTSSVNASALGNSFSHNGQRISVVNARHSPSGEVAGIDLQSAPEAVSAGSKRSQPANANTGASRQWASNSRTSTNRPQASNAKPKTNNRKSSNSPYKKGLTYEEELFRTKWGWDAFARAQSLGNHQ